MESLVISMVKYYKISFGIILLVQVFKRLKLFTSESGLNSKVVSHEFSGRNSSSMPSKTPLDVLRLAELLGAPLARRAAPT